MKTTIKLTVIAVLMLMMLIACTPAGTPLSMVGQWKLTAQGTDDNLRQPPYELLYDFKDDDTIYTKTIQNGEDSGWNKSTTIKRCDCKSITIAFTENNHEKELTWNWEISGNNMTWTREDEGYTITMKFTKK